MLCFSMSVYKAFDKVPHLPLIQQLQELYVDPYRLIDYIPFQSRPTSIYFIAASTQTSEDCTKQDSTITLQAPVGTLLLATNGSHSYCTLDDINSVPAPDLIMSSVAIISFWQ